MHWISQRTHQFNPLLPPPQSFKDTLLKQDNAIIITTTPSPPLTLRMDIDIQDCDKHSPPINDSNKTPITIPISLEDRHRIYHPGESL